MSRALSIVIPAYNETPRLPQTLSAIRGFFSGPHGDVTLGEVIVVDDGSTDGTPELAESWNDRLPMRVIRLPKNRGKGAAVRAGMLAAKEELVLMYDADGATPIDEVPGLVDEMFKTNADIAIGSRVDRTSSVSMQGYRRIIGRTYHALCAKLHPGIRDAACGCKLFKREVAQDLFSRQRIDRFAFDIEILSLALLRGYRVAQVPVRWTAVEKSKVRIWRDGPQMFWCILKMYRDRTLRRGAFANV
jgi:dolichyl-phosphate beta-glucosyltransferase